MNRMAVLDGFRGLFLLLMALLHFDGLTDSWLGYLHHGRFGWVEDAQGFVFISGLVVGLVYGRKYLRRPSLRAIFGPILARVRTIYAYQAGMILLLLAAAFALGDLAGANFAPYREAPVSFVLASLALVSSSANMGILPMYIFFLLATPFAFRALHRGQVAPFFFAVLLAWTAAQTNLAGMLFHQGQLALVDQGIEARFGIYFSLLGWQALFFCGLYVGYLMAEGRLDLGFLRAGQWRTTFFMAVAAILALGVYDLVVEHRLLGEEYTNRVIQKTPRSVLGYLYPVAFAVDLFVVVWLLIAGPEDRRAAVRKAAAGLRWLVTRPMFTLLGTHSLQVFSMHILAFYALATVMEMTDLGQAGRTAALLAALASLYGVAMARSWLAARGGGGSAVAAE